MIYLDKIHIRLEENATYTVGFAEETYNRTGSISRIAPFKAEGYCFWQREQVERCLLHTRDVRNVCLPESEQFSTRHVLERDTRFSELLFESP